MTSLQSRTRAVIWVGVWLGALSLIITSGRLASGDAGQQYRQADNFVRTGQLYDDSARNYLWLPGQDGHQYEVHDPGNMILMLPAAAVDAVRHPTSTAAPPDHVSAFLVALTYAMFACAALLALLYALIDQIPDRRYAVIAVLVFVFATAYAAYQKTAWDVLGACLATCFAIAAVVAVRRRAEDGRSVIIAAVAIGASLSLTAAFRFTWAPFLAFTLLGLLATARVPSLLRIGLWTAGSALVFSLPQFAFNAVRSGNPLIPHTAAYHEATSFAGNMPKGFAQYLISPEFGLLVYCPLFLLFLIPAVYRRVRWPVWPALAGVFLYTILLASISAIPPGTTWGPRYLVPTLPLLFFVLAPGIRQLLRQRGWRVLTFGVVGISVVVSVAALLFPWQDDLHTWHGGKATQVSAWNSDRITLAADALIGGAISQKAQYGFRLENGRDITKGQGFPDFWWVSAIEQGGRTRLAGILGSLLLIGLFGVSSSRLWRLHDDTYKNGEGGSSHPKMPMPSVPLRKGLRHGA